MSRDRVVLVTGGGSGIGAATAFRFAREGANVVVTDLDNEAAMSVARGIAEGGGEAIAYQMDVRNSEAVETVVLDLVSKYGGIDTLFNSAGILGRENYLWDATVNDFDEIISANLKGVFLCCKYVVPVMIEKNTGVIINMASLGGLVARPMNSIYSASKAGVILMTKVLAKELAPYGIRVNCIAPISVDTPMLDGWPAEARSSTSSRIPLGRIVKPEEIAAAACFLASDDAQMITGIPLVIDGGYTA